MRPFGFRQPDLGSIVEYPVRLTQRVQAERHHLGRRFQGIQVGRLVNPVLDLLAGNLLGLAKNESKEPFFWQIGPVSQCVH